MNFPRINIVFYMRCDCLNGFIWGVWFQESKHEEKIDENSCINPVEVQMHDLVSVCLLCNFVKTETFVLFFMHCDYLNGLIGII
jgi:hypothetical protein